LVPQGDEEPGGLEGPQDAHRGIRRQGDREDGRGAAADRRRRHLSRPGEGHDRRRGMGRPLRRPEARLQQGREALLLSGLEGGQQLTTMCNIAEWNKLPKEYQNVLEAACWEANTWMVAKYDAQNPAALKRLVGGGTVLRPFNKEIMVASYKASLEVYKEASE